MVYIEEFPDRMDFIDDAKVDLDNSEKEKIEYWSFPKLYDKHQEVFDHFFGKRLSQLNKHHQGNISSMLDIGSGYGFWMKFCRDRGIDVYGIDPSKETVDWGREKYGLDMDVGLLETFNTDRKWDSIVMCDVLEHLKEPVEQLARVREFLSDDGLLYIQVPNLLGFKLPMGHGYGLPHHLWQFSAGTLKETLRLAGLKPIGLYTGVMGVIGSYENGGPGIFEKLTWAIAGGLKIGNRLQIVVGKA